MNKSAKISYGHFWSRKHINHFQKQGKMHMNQNK